MAWYSTTNFEHGMDGWRALNRAGNVSVRRMTDGSARSGNTYLRCRTTVVDGSVAADIDKFVDLRGSTDLLLPGLAVDAWVRAVPGGPPVSGLLTIWELGRPTADNHPDTAFTVGSQWVEVSNCISFLTVGRGRARIEFYIKTVNADLDIDCVRVT